MEDSLIGQQKAAARPAWYKRPFAAIIFIVTVVGGLATLLTNLSTIYSFFVVDKPRLELEFWMAGEIPENFSAPNTPAFYIITFMLRKSGSAPLHNCRFEGDDGGMSLSFSLRTLFHFRPAR